MRLPLRSPEIATFMFFSVFFFDFSVKRSHSVCVGCSWLPSPPLMTGICEYSAASRAAPSRGWRMTTMSA